MAQGMYGKTKIKRIIQIQREGIFVVEILK